MATNSTNAGFGARIVEQLLRLRAHDAALFTELTDPRDVFRYRMRAGGRSVEIVVDLTVLELRVYHDDDVVATARLTERVAETLIGRAPASRDLAAGVSADEARAALRAVIGDWRRRNARTYISAPDVARHPDGWNNS